MPDKENAIAVSRKQKNVLEQNIAEGVARTMFCESRAAERRRCCYRVLKLSEIYFLANLAFCNSLLHKELRFPKTVKTDKSDSLVETVGK